MVTPALSGRTLAADLRSFRDRPLTNIQCGIGWIGATLVFLGFTFFLGGPSYPDFVESWYSTLAAAHGQFSCFYPPVGPEFVRGVASSPIYIAPLYPLVSGLVAAVIHLGHAVPYPPVSQMGSHCERAVFVLNQWSTRSGAVVTLPRLSYLSWIPLGAGVVAVMRGLGRGRRGAEVLVLLGVAVTPPVFMCLGYVFHPEYLWAMGFALIAVSAAHRHRWMIAGVALGLAILSQQYAILVAAVLVMASPPRGAMRMIGAATATFGAVVIPLALLTSRHAVAVALFGSSRLTPLDASSRSTGGTVLWELHLRGLALFMTARLAPVAASAALAWVARRRLGDRALSGPVLLALVAMSLSLRLVFEENLFGYYFMALAVALIVVDAVQGRLRGSVVVWISLVTLAFNPIPSGFASRYAPWGIQGIRALPTVFVVAAGLVVVVDAFRGRLRPYLLAALVFTLLVFHHLILSGGVDRATLPHWLWQILLVPSGVALAAQPLWRAWRDDESVAVIGSRGSAAR